jgi:hypothetical protein
MPYFQDFAQRHSAFAVTREVNLPILIQTTIYSEKHNTAYQQEFDSCVLEIYERV